MKPNTPLRVAIYTRISEDSESKGEGVARQEADCRARAEREGWEVVEPVYEENDTGASRQTRKVRTKYPAMLEAARRGEFDLVLAYSNSRLTRRLREYLDLIDLFNTTGVQIRTIVSGDDDLSTADGQAVALTKATWDQAESARTGERVRRAQVENRANGGQGTKRAFGWEHTYVGEGRNAQRGPDALHRKEGPALKEGLTRIAEGHSLASVARHWNSQGLTTLTGKAWTLTRTKEVLLRYRNCGVIVHQGQPINGVGSWEPACTREQFETVRAILTSRTSTRSTTPRSLLSYVANCGKCGRPMIAGKQASGEVYRCSGSHSANGDKCWVTIMRDHADEVVTKALITKLFLTHPADMQQEAEPARLRALYADLSAAQAKVGLLVDALLSGALKPSDVGGNRKALNDEEANIKAEIDSIVENNATLSLTSAIHASLFTSHKISIADGVRVKSELRAKFLEMDLDRQRVLVRSLGKISVNPGRSADRVEIGES